MKPADPKLPSAIAALKVSVCHFRPEMVVSVLRSFGPNIRAREGLTAGRTEEQYAVRFSTRG